MLRGIILMLLLTTTVEAQGLTDYKDPERQTESARRRRSVGIQVAQAGAVFVGIVLVLGGYSTLTRGFKITESTVIKGKGAAVIAIVFFLLGLTVGVGGVFLAQRYAPLG